MVREFRMVVLAVALCGLTAGSAFAQLTTGEIFGKATDATSAAIPGVTVTLEGASLQQPLVAVTTSTGAYRFPQIPIGSYTVTFSLSGFTTVKREKIVVQTGFSAEINARLDVSTVQETVTVSGAAPVVDTKNVSTGATFNREVLDAVPTARDPWTVLNMVPGVIISGVNVGGSTSGQQPNFSARGESTSAGMWNIDGGTTTDMAATGGSAQYYDFDAFEEIQVTTGGSDVSVQTSGININLVTRSGSNVFKGTARGAYDGAKTQFNNVSRELFYSGGSTTTPLSGAPLKHFYEVGGELGGPIQRNRFWWWGAGAQQRIDGSVLGFFKDTPECTPPPNDYDHIKDTQKCLHDDLTVLTNYNGKLNYQLNAANKFAFLYNFSDKTRNARGANDTHPPETTYRQYNSHNPLHAGYNVKHTWVLTDKLVFDNTLEVLQGGFSLDFQDPATQYNLQPLLDGATNVWHRALDQYITTRPTTEAKTDSSYFLSNLLGGDHALKFGFRYRNTPWQTFDHYGGYAIANINRTTSPTGAYAYLERDHNVSIGLYTLGSYLQDWYSLKRLRINAGLRWDYQNDSTSASSVVANPIVPDLLPAYDYAGFDSGITFSDFSPRLSATYDLLGDGKTIVKGTYAFYYNQVGGNSGGLYSNVANPAAQVEIRVPWTDLNGDQFITRDELDLSAPLVTTGSWDVSTGSPVASANTVDPNIKNARTREGIVGIDHELMANFGVGVSYIYRVFDRRSFTTVNGATQGLFEPVAFVPTAAQLAALPAGVDPTGWQVLARRARQPRAGERVQPDERAGRRLQHLQGLGSDGAQAAEQPLAGERLVHVERPAVVRVDVVHAHQRGQAARGEQCDQPVRGQAERQLPAHGRVERRRQRQHPGRRRPDDHLPVLGAGLPELHHVGPEFVDGRLPGGELGNDAPADAEDDGRDAGQGVRHERRPPAAAVGHGVQSVQRGHHPGLLEQPAGPGDVHADSRASWRRASCASWPP